MKLWWSLALVCCILTGCKERQLTLSDPQKTNAGSMEGKLITIQGKALNAKAGAMAGNYYVEGLGAWPDDAYNRTVEVTGTLKVVEHAAEDLRNPDGSYNQGMVGQQMILMKPTWHVIGE